MGKRRIIESAYRISGGPHTLSKSMRRGKGTSTSPARATLKGLGERPYETIAQRDKGELMGLTDTEIPAIAAERKETLAHIRFLATKRRGYGAELMVELCKRAVASDVGITLIATRKAQPFYDKMGMRRIGISHYAFTKEEADEFIKRAMSLSKELEELEPEDGIFVVPEEEKEEGEEEW